MHGLSTARTIMKNSLLSIIALSAALSGPVLAQGTAPAMTSKDPVVVMRAEERAAKATYKQKMSALTTEHKAAISGAGEAAAKDAKAKGSDPLVARRDAEAKAKKMSQSDYDRKVKALKTERKAALDAAAKKGKGA
jgi:hypothetical protein